MRGHQACLPMPASAKVRFPLQLACAVPAILAGGSGYALCCSSQPAVVFSQEGGPSAPQPVAKGPLAAAGAGVPDAIAGALKRFGLKHPTRPVGVAKIDLASSFTDASSPANAVSGATSKPTAAAGQSRHNLCTIKCLVPLHEKQVSHCGSALRLLVDAATSALLRIKGSHDTFVAVCAKQPRHHAKQIGCIGLFGSVMCASCLPVHPLYHIMKLPWGVFSCFICCACRCHGTG